MKPAPVNRAVTASPTNREGGAKRGIADKVARARAAGRVQSAPTKNTAGKREGEKQ